MLKEYHVFSDLLDKKDMLLVVVLFSFGIRFSDAVVCLSCSSEPKASDCMTVEKCGSHSACSVEMFVSAAGFVRYNVGCKDKQFWHSSRRRSKGIQNITSLLEREERATTVCRECCDNDLCNAAGCTSPGYATPRGPVCYACAQQQSQGACNQIQLCGRDEYCYMERHQYGTDYLYTSACMSKLTCNALGITGMAHTVHVATIIGRNVNEPLDETINVRQHEKFSDKDKRTANVNPRLCCTTDLCNNGSMLIAVNGGWSAWSSWSGCSVTCNTGVRTRTRSCTNPAPRNGGSVCTGNSQESHTCKITDCPIDGSWSSWSIWSSCSATCGAAISSRTRSCSNPASRYGGKHCVGLSHGSVPCHLQHCPVDGEWSGWSTWGSCSASCGVATKSRSRTCSNPAPRYGGKSCLGNSQDQTSCNLHSCKVDGQWSSWNSWTACTASCGTAPKSRSRLCNNPAPANGGKACTGGSTETTSCNLQACPGTVLANPSTMPTYTCLSCSASASPRDCNFVQQCGPNSVCYLEKHLTTGAYYSFYSGCRDRQFCHSKIGRRRDLYTNTSVFGDDLNNDKKYPRNAINNDKIVCSECCEGDLCNSKGCSEPGYPPKQGPICYKCDQQSSPHQCNEITICNTGEACHLTYTQFIGVVYSTGCHKKADCMAKGYYNTGPVATMIGRRAANLLKPSYHANNTSAVRSNLDRRWITPCSKCCSGNLCNRDTCQNIIQHTTTNAIFTATPATTKPSSNPQLTTVHNALSTKGHHQQTSHKTSPVKVTPTTNMHYVTSYITHSQHVSQPVTTNKHHGTTKAHHHVTTAKRPVTVPVTQMSTTHRHNAGGGHIVSVCPVWAAWTQWSSCNEARVQLTGYAERRRTCNDGNFELDKKYCGQYITPHCVPPTITQVDVTIGAWTAGGSVNLECTVAGSPTPTITWKCFNNCEALPDLFEYGQSIFASNLDSRYSGTYQCVADNQCGHATKNYVATVT